MVQYQAMSERTEQAFSYEFFHTLAEKKLVRTTELSLQGENIYPHNMVQGFLWFLTSGELRLIKSTFSGIDGLISVFNQTNDLVISGTLFKSLVENRPPSPRSNEFFKTSKKGSLKGFCFIDLTSNQGAVENITPNFLPQLYFYIANALRHKEAEITTRITKEISLFLYQKLANYLLEQLKLSKKNSIAISHERLAEFFGRNRENITEQLGLMQDLNLIAQGHNKITILNPQGLQDLVDGKIKLYSQELKPATTTLPETAQ